MIIDLFHYPQSISEPELLRLAPALQVKVFTSILIALVSGSPSPEPQQVATDLMFIRRIVLESLSEEEATLLTNQYLEEIDPPSLREILCQRVLSIMQESQTGIGNLDTSRFTKAVFKMQRDVRSKRMPSRHTSPPPRRVGPTVKGFKR